MKALKPKYIIRSLLTLAPMILIVATILFAGVTFNSNVRAESSNNLTHIKLDSGTCGGGTTSDTPSGTTTTSRTSDAVKTSINFGCTGKGNPITDLIFAVIRFLSAGVGLVIIASVIVGGIQYIVSGGDPSATQKAVNRLVTSLVALLIFIFAYAILNYIIPGGFFN